MNQQGKNLKAVLFSLAVCLAVSLIHAQQPGGIFYHLTTRNGLSSNRVNAVIQDREGFYWIATGDGLNRFDGSSCKVFRNSKNDSNSLSHNSCVYLLEDDLGDIWVGTPRGVNRYSKKKNRFERIYLSHPSLLFDQVNVIRGIAKDDHGNIWIGSEGLWQYNIHANKWTVYLNDPLNSASIPKGFNYSLQYDKVNKGLWMTNPELIFFDIGKKTFYHKDNNPGNFYRFDTPFWGGNFILDSFNTIWFCHRHSKHLSSYSIGNKTIRVFPVKDLPGIYNLSVDTEKRIWIYFWHEPAQIYDPRKDKIDTAFLTQYHPQSPLTNIVTNLYIDKTGNYWISSSKGISIYNPKAQAVKYIWMNDGWKTDEGLNNSITCLAEHNENILWVGTKAGLFQFDCLQKKFTPIRLLPVRSSYIRCLYLQNDSILWIGTWGDLLLFDLLEKKIIKKISVNGNPQFITAGSQGDIWVGTWSDGLFKFTTSGELSDSLVHSSGNAGSIKYNGLNCFGKNTTEPGLWIGYNFEHGFFRLNDRSHKIQNFKVPTPLPYANTSNSINCITEDNHGNVWLGTYGGGLVYFDRRKNNFTSYTQSDGLKGDYINSILQDSHSNTWISTSNGLSIIEARTNSIINSDINLEFSDNDFVSNGIRRKNGKLLFFSGLRIVEIDPVNYLQSAYPSQLLLSSFKVFEEETALAEDKDHQPAINLSYHQNFFSFEYSLLKPNPETATQYSYKLEGFDKDWNNVRERRMAYYTNVPPGNYKFMVKASDEGGELIYFSKPVAITISPPFWRTAWFIALAVASLAGGLYIFYRYRINQVKKLFGLRSKISQDLHDEVASTLSGIRLYSELAKDQLEQSNAPMARRSLETISSNTAEMIQGMSDIIWTINPVNDSFRKLLQKLRAYATELTHARGISFNYIIKGEIPEEKLNMQQRRNIYLVCKEAINNAVKYSGAGNITIQVQHTDHAVYIILKDDGSGFDIKQSSEGNGLLNMKIRAKEIGAVLLINSTIGSGTEIQLQVKM